MYFTNFCHPWNMGNNTFPHCWVQRYKGLVYYPNSYGVLFIYCALFYKDSQPCVLVKKPYTSKFHKSSTILGDHFVDKGWWGKCYHWTSREAAGNFISVMAGDIKLIQYQMDHAAYAQLQQNRQKLQFIIKCVIFCGKKNITLRGDKGDSQ